MRAPDPNHKESLMTIPDESPSAVPSSEAKAAWPSSGVNFHGHEAPAATPGFRELPTSAPASARPAPKLTIVHRNRTALTTLAVVAAYVVLALTTRVVLLGIFPVVLSLRAFRRGEQLAPLAIIAAIGAVIFSLAFLSHN
jgi:hypothetical protein